MPDHIRKIDTAIRFFLYVLIFWLPYGSAVVETCVVFSVLLWITKRSLLACSLPAEAGGARNLFFFLKAFKPSFGFLAGPISVFLFVCFVSLFNSVYPMQSWRGFFTKTLEWFIVLGLVAEVFTEKKFILIALIVFTVSSFSTAVDGIIQFYITKKDFFLGQVITRGGATAAFNHSNGLGAYLTSALPIGLALFFLGKKHPYQRIMLGLVFLMLLWALAVTLSRASWLANVWSTIIFLALTRKKRIAFLLIVVVAVAVYYFGHIPFADQSHLRIDAVDIQKAADWRVNLWKDALTMAQARPMLGYGLNTFMRMFSEYGEVVRGKGYYSPTYAHNGYIQILAEIGVLGLIAFLWIMIRLFANSIRALNESKDRELGILLSAFLAALAGGLVHSFFDTDFYSLKLSVLFWLMAGFAVCLGRLLSESPIYGIKLT